MSRQLELTRVEQDGSSAVYRSKPILAALDEVLEGAEDVSGLFPDHEIICGDVFGYADAHASPAEEVDVSGWLNRDGGVYRKVGKKWVKLDPETWKWPSEGKAELTKMVSYLAARLKSPFKLPANASLVVGKDDLAIDKVRINAGSGKYVSFANVPMPAFDVYGAHTALDIGSRVSKDGGQTVYFLGTSPLYLVCKMGYFRRDSVGALEQKVLLQEGSYRALLHIDYGHTQVVKGVTRKWKKVTDTAFANSHATLEGNDDWHSSDPAMTKKYGKLKGNHIDLQIAGIVSQFDFAAKHIIEWNRVLRLGRKPANKDDWDYVDTRRTYFNTTVLQAILNNPRQ
jgi:hypothetical protein